MEVPRGMEPTGTNGRTRHTLSDPCGSGLVLWWFSRWMARNAVSCGHNDDAGKAFIVRVRCPVPGPPRPESWLVSVLPAAGFSGWPSCIGFAVVMAQVRRPVPFRTRKLRPGTAMVLHSRGCGRVARRRIQRWTFWSSPLRDSRKVFFLSAWGFPGRYARREPPFFVFLPDFSGPSRTSRQRLSGSSKVFFRGLRPSRASGPPGRSSMTPRRVLLLSGAYRRTRVAGDPFFSHDRSDWMVGCSSKLDASLFSNVVQDLQHSIAILLFADVACGMQYPDHFIPFRPHASQFFLGGVSESHQHRLATE